MPMTTFMPTTDAIQDAERRLMESEALLRRLRGKTPIPSRGNF